MVKKSANSTSDGEVNSSREKRFVPNERDEMDDIFLDLPLNLSTIDWVDYPSKMITYL